MASFICTSYEEFISICISNEGKVYSFGKSTKHTHGHKKDSIISPTMIKGLSNIKMIACSSNHIICLDTEANIYSFGSNANGRLGIGKNSGRLLKTHIPQKINILPINKVNCGYNFTICLSEDNLLYSFGENNHGQLGLNNNIIFNTPQLIPDLYDIEIIECGGHHAICKSYSDECYSWGHNKYGELGQNIDNDACLKPTKTSNWPENIISIRCGTYHSLLLTEEGKVYSFGNNYCGQLGINDNSIKISNIPNYIDSLEIITRIECGYDHYMCIDKNNDLWLFGHNKYGQLGLGDKTSRFKPILHPDLHNIIDISSGGHHTFVKTSSYEIFTFGRNDHLQLGIKTSDEYQLTPIQVLKEKEDIWSSSIGKSRAKSARK